MGFFFLIFTNRSLLLHVCLCTMCVALSMEVRRGCQIPPELELWANVSYHWVLEITPRSSGTAASTHKRWAISAGIFILSSYTPPSFSEGKRIFCRYQRSLRPERWGRELPECLPCTRNRHLHSTSSWRGEGGHPSPSLPSLHLAQDVCGMHIFPVLHYLLSIFF